MRLVKKVCLVNGHLWASGVDVSVYVGDDLPNAPVAIRVETKLFDPMTNKPSGKVRVEEYTVPPSSIALILEKQYVLEAE